MVPRSRYSVETIFSAVDRMTAPVSRMQARVGKFTRGMQRNLRGVNRVVGKLNAGLKRAAMVGGAALIGAGVATAAALQRVANEADSLAKQSRRLQFPVEELQEWRFVAEQSGVSSDLLGRSLGAFTKRLGEARSGIGPLTTMLKKSDPALLQQLNSTNSVADAFDLYLKAIRQAPTAAQKAALASAAFSRAGLDMVNITHSSASSIEALRAEMRRNGVMTMEQVENAEKYNDALNSLRRSIGGVIQSALLPLLPRLTMASERMRELVLDNKELIKVKVEEYFIKIRDGVSGLVESFIEFNRETQFLQRVIDFIKFLAKNAGTILKVTAAVYGLITALKIFNGVMTAVNLVMALNPVTWIVLGFVALGAALAYVITQWDNITAGFAAFPAWAKLIAGATAFIIEPLRLLWDVITGDWGGVVGWFLSQWEGLLTELKAIAADIMWVVDGIVKGAKWTIDLAARFLGFGGGDDVDGVTGAGASAAAGAQVVGPGERTARSIEESRTTNSAEVTLRTERGTSAEVTRGNLGGGVTLQPSGTF